METARVTDFFDRRDYGFAVILDSEGRDTDEILFLHKRDSRMTIVARGTVQFGSRTRRNDQGDWEQQRNPRRGDPIVFQRAPKPKGGKISATVWCLQEIYEESRQRSEKYGLVRHSSRCR